MIGRDGGKISRPMGTEDQGGCLDGALYEAPIEQVRNFTEFRFPRKMGTMCIFGERVKALDENKLVWMNCDTEYANSAFVAVYVPDRMRSEGQQTKIWLKFRRYDNI